jgi:hypothetical protein
MANNYRMTPAQTEMKQVTKIRKEIQNSFHSFRKRKRCQATLPDGTKCNLPYSLHGRKVVNDQRLNPDLCGYHSMRKSNQERQLANRIIKNQEQMLQLVKVNCGLLNNPRLETGKL